MQFVHFFIKVKFMGQKIGAACAAAGVFWVGAAWAQQPLTLERGSEPRSVSVSVLNPASGACGAEMELGDGRVERKRLEPGETWKVPHTYSADGEFVVSLRGAAIVRGLRSVLACDLKATARLDTRQGRQAQTGASPAAMPAAATTPAAAPATAAAPVQAPAPTVSAAPAASAASPAVAPAATAPMPAVAVAPAAPSALAAAPDAGTDFAVFARKASSSVRYVNTLDGGRRLASAEELARNGYSVCLLTQSDLKRTLPGIEPEMVVLDHLERVILGQRQVRRNVLSCVNNGNFVLGSRPDVVAAPRQYLRAMRSSTPAFADYDEIGEVKFSVLAQASERVVRAQDERRRVEQSWAAELEALAASGSKDKMGSLTLSALRLSAAAPAYRPNAAALRSSRNVRICALEYSGADRQAVLGYGYRRWRGYSQAFQANAEAAGLTIHPDTPITRGYASIEEIYTAYQQDPEACQIVVDFSRNLKLLMNAIERDKRQRAFEINEVVAVSELRDEWARKNGFPNMAASELATQIGANPSTIKRLASAGVANKADYAALVEQMRTERYSEKAGLNDVLTYLDDRAKAATLPGATALSVLNERREKEAAEARAQAEKAEAEAKVRREREEAQRIAAKKAEDLLLNKRWSIGELPCNLNGGAYIIYTNRGPSGDNLVLAGKLNQSEQKQEYSYTFIDANTVEYRHNIYSGGNAFVMNMLRDPDVLMSGKVSRITIVSPTRIEYRNTLRTIDFDQMLKGNVRHQTKEESGFRTLCK